MTDIQLKKLLDQLRGLPAETEWLEFKHASNNFDFKKLGKYFSALSNEANLKNKPCGWLIFGIEDKTRRIVGTKYRPNRASLDSLKSEIAEKTNGRITFIEIFEVQLLPQTHFNKRHRRKLVYTIYLHNSKLMSMMAHNQ